MPYKANTEYVCYMYRLPIWMFGKTGVRFFDKDVFQRWLDQTTSETKVPAKTKVDGRKVRMEVEKTTLPPCLRQRYDRA